MLTRFFLEYKLVRIVMVILDGGWWSRTIRRAARKTSDAIASNKGSNPEKNPIMDPIFKRKSNKGSNPEKKRNCPILSLKKGSNPEKKNQ